jgi:hypothetical protein
MTSDVAEFQCFFPVIFLSFFRYSSLLSNVNLANLVGKVRQIFDIEKLKKTENPVYNDK